MKIFIVTVAVVILYSFTVVFFQDYRQSERSNYRVKYVCEELSASAATFYDAEEYANGFKIFDTYQGIRAIEDQITHLLAFDSNGVPVSGSYWTGNLHYKAYFYDDSLEKKVYTDGSLTSEESFSYPYSHFDDWTSCNKLITSPTVVVTINAGPGRYRLNFLDIIPDTVRTAAHVQEDR